MPNAPELESLMLDPNKNRHGVKCYCNLAGFRQELYHCFGNGKDTLMNLVDAMLSGPQARSFAELSLSPAFTRQWSSIYEVFDDAQINRKALQQLFVKSIPKHSPSTRLILAADATPITRPESPTAADRTYVHVPNAPKGAKPVCPGWQFATVVALPENPSSRTTILDNRRIRSGETAAQVVASQIGELAQQLPADTVVTLDGGFGNASFVAASLRVPVCKLMRTAKNRTLYRPKPEATCKAGRPRLDGDPFTIRDCSTHGPPDDHWSGKDEKGQWIEVDCWNNLHFYRCREASLTLIRVSRQNGPDTKRNPRVIWLIWHAAPGQGESSTCDTGVHMTGRAKSASPSVALCDTIPSNALMPPLERIPHIYRLRYCIEHSYRFDKQNLLWTKPRLRTPEKFEIWTYIVSAVHNHITLAYEYHQDFRMPWANPASEPSPEQVRRGLEGIIAQLGTPARPTLPRGKAPGRQKGAIITKAERFKTIWKSKKQDKEVQATIST